MFTRFLRRLFGPRPDDMVVAYHRNIGKVGKHRYSKAARFVLTDTKMVSYWTPGGYLQYTCSRHTLRAFFLHWDATGRLCIRFEQGVPSENRKSSVEYPVYMEDDGLKVGCLFFQRRDVTCIREWACNPEQLPSASG